MLFVKFYDESVEIESLTKRKVLFTFYGMLLLPSSFIVFIFCNFGLMSRESILAAEVFGFGSMILEILQYLPQILKTLRLEEVGSLSTKTMMMQSPGRP